MGAVSGAGQRRGLSRRWWAAARLLGLWCSTQPRPAAVAPAATASPEACLPHETKTCPASASIDSPIALCQPAIDQPPTNAAFPLETGDSPKSHPLQRTSAPISRASRLQLYARHYAPAPPQLHLQPAASRELDKIAARNPSFLVLCAFLAHHRTFRSLFVLRSRRRPCNPAQTHFPTRRTAVNPPPRARSYPVRPRRPHRPCLPPVHPHASPSIIYPPTLSKTSRSSRRCASTWLHPISWFRPHPSLWTRPPT